jgi:hypothetical protein
MPCRPTHPPAVSFSPLNHQPLKLTAFIHIFFDVCINGAFQHTQTARPEPDGFKLAVLYQIVNMAISTTKLLCGIADICEFSDCHSFPF